MLVKHLEVQLLLLFPVISSIVLADNATFGFSSTITVKWNELHQQMDGFGTFAGRSIPFYQDPLRDEIMERLYGPTGLQLTILRSTIFPDLNFSLPIPNSTLEHIAETWIIKTAQERYNVEKFISSAWTPPTQWKTVKGDNTGKGFNRLADEHYSDYAQYLVNFINWYRSLGINLHAISPQNEPEYSAPSWDGCIWLPQQTAKFTSEHLKPMLMQNGINTKVMIGENANWSVANIYLFLVSLFTNGKGFDIVASHGYSLPMLPSTQVTYNTVCSPPELKANKKWQKPQWITEVCSTENYDASMNKGLELALSMHRFLTSNNVNAFVFWLGTVNKRSNEALVMSDGQGHLEMPKVYDVFGHFSRYIRPNWFRMSAKRSFWTYLTDIHVAAFRDSNSGEFSIVIINKDKHAENINLDFEGVSVDPSSIQFILSNESNTWMRIGGNFESGKITVLIPGSSVITVVGRASLSHPPFSDHS